MVVIDSRYLENENIRNNTVTRSEVLASVFVEKYILSDAVLHVGIITSKNLPDIHNDDNTVGFEVVTCEAYDDYALIDRKRELQKKNCHEDGLNKVKDLDKKEYSEHILGKDDVDLREMNNLIKPLPLFHYENWMGENYKKRIHNKLDKLNKGNYAECLNISLIVLTLLRDNKSSAQQIQEIYYKEAQNFTLSFNCIYFVTNSGIYTIKENGTSVLKKFMNDEFSQCVIKMKQLLRIDEYNL